MTDRCYRQQYGSRDFFPATEDNDRIAREVSDVIHVPSTLESIFPLLAIVPLQLLAYHIAVARGCDVDKPRNLAKSVTVE